MIQVKNKVVSGQFECPGSSTYVLDDSEPREGKKINSEYKITVTPYRGFRVLCGDSTNGFMDIIKVGMPTEANNYLFKVLLRNRETNKKTIEFIEMVNLQAYVISNKKKLDAQKVSIYCYLQQLSNDFETSELVVPSYTVKIKKIKG